MISVTRRTASTETQVRKRKVCIRAAFYANVGNRFEVRQGLFGWLQRVSICWLDIKCVENEVHDIKDNITKVLRVCTRSRPVIVPPQSSRICTLVRIGRLIGEATVKSPGLVFRYRYCNRILQIWEYESCSLLETTEECGGVIAG